MLLINESDWQEIKRKHAQEIKERDQKIEQLSSELDEVQRNYDELINDILDGAPECWDGDQSDESLCVDYVRSLDSRTTKTIGHRDDCNCWS